MLSDAGVLFGALLLSLLHSMIPNHWGPFVLVGRMRRWSRTKLALVTLIAGLLHAGVTMALGLGVAYAGQATRAEHLKSLESVAAILLIATGAILILGRALNRHLHRHFDPAKWSTAADALLIFALVGMLSLSPCAEILPLYLLAAAGSWTLVMWLSIVVVLATSIGMTLIVVLIGDKISEMRFGLIEENAGWIAGTLLIALGAMTAYLHDGLLPGVHSIVTFGMETLASARNIFVDAAPYILFGCLMGGFVYAFIQPERVAEHLGTGRLKPVIKAALFGVPLPLCSCGVIPAALTLRRMGASRGATTAFLITTPETGVDSIAVTYALLDPIYTVFRPIAAFLTGVTAGTLEVLFGHREDPKPPEKAADPCPACHAEPTAPGMADNKAGASPKRTSIAQKIKTAVTYGLGDFLADIALWLIIGFLAAGLILTVVPPQAIERSLSGFPGMLLVLIVSIPLYICASATTPMAAALLLQGASPGAALVLLLAGPASNTAGIVMLTRFLGKRSVIIYLSSIAVCSLVFGLLLNALYQALGIDPRASVGAHHAAVDGGFKIACAWILAALVAFYLIRDAIRYFGHHVHAAHETHGLQGG